MTRPATGKAAAHRDAIIKLNDEYRAITGHDFYEYTSVPGDGQTRVVFNDKVVHGYAAGEAHMAAALRAARGEEPAYRPLHKISDDIARHWPEPYFAARPYIYGLRKVATLTDRFGTETGRDLVSYFLSNAGTWRGEDARRIKEELRAILKAGR